MNKKINILVNSDYDAADQRLDNFLVKQFKQLPKSCIYRLLRKGLIRVNRKRAKPSYKLQLNDLITGPVITDLAADNNSKSQNTSKLQKLLSNNILYEDNKLIIINKPAGLAVHGGSGLSFGAIEILRQLKGDNIELVHRLDKDTSGCLMLAKKRSALRNMHQLLRERKITKIYRALVHGKWPAKAVTVKNYLQKNILDSGERMVRVVNSELKTSQLAVTKFKLLHYFSDLDISLIQAEPVTGRTHQIRVHARSQGHSIINDTKYGNSKLDQKLTQKLAKLNNTNNKVHLALHAYELQCENSEFDFDFTVTAKLNKTWFNLELDKYV